MNLARLQHLRDFVAFQPEHRIDMLTVANDELFECWQHRDKRALHNECGAAGCLAGLLPFAFPELGFSLAHGRIMPLLYTGIPIGFDHALIQALEIENAKIVEYLAVAATYPQIRYVGDGCFQGRIPQAAVLARLDRVIAHCKRHRIEPDVAEVATWMRQEREQYDKTTQLAGSSAG